MVHVVRNARDAIHERDPVGEARKGERLHERVTATRPAVQRAERAMDLDVGELAPHGSDSGHGGFYRSRADSKDPRRTLPCGSGYLRYTLSEEQVGQEAG